jgi:hypothetical protein
MYHIFASYKNNKYYVGSAISSNSANHMLGHYKSYYRSAKFSCELKELKKLDLFGYYTQLDFIKHYQSGHYLTALLEQLPA